MFLFLFSTDVTCDVIFVLIYLQTTIKVIYFIGISVVVLSSCRRAHLLVCANLPQGQINMLINSWSIFDNIY